MIFLIQPMIWVEIGCSSMVNYNYIPKQFIDNIEEFNKLVMKYNNSGLYRGIARTPSGGISIKKKYKLGCSYDVTFTKKGDGISGAELLVLDGPLEMRYILGKPTGNTIKGSVAFKRFKDRLNYRGVRIEDDYIDNGEEVKQDFPNPLIRLYGNSNQVYENVYHIDINSSFPYGMSIYKPHWAPVIQKLYNERKKKPENKLVLNSLWGYCQSEWLKRRGKKYLLADVSKFAIELNNNRIYEELDKIMDAGHLPLMLNTDGIWFVCKDPTFVDQYRGKTQLGEFKLDHTNCTFRAKSAGSYEFIENGKYKPVVRGATKLDKIKDRTLWEWGDIYRDTANPILWVEDEKNFGCLREV